MGQEEAVLAYISQGLVVRAPDSSHSALSGLHAQCSYSQAPRRHCYCLSKLTFVHSNRAPAPQEDWVLGSVFQDTSCLQYVK